jgi:hypothetical protein
LRDIEAQRIVHRDDMDSTCRCADTGCVRRRALRSVSAFAAAGIAVTALVPGASAGDRQDSGIRGSVVPCGLIHERAARCAIDAGNATVLVRDARGARVIATAKADRRGRFRVGLPAGSYLVQSRPKGSPARGASVPAKVPEHGWVTVTVPAGPMAPAASAGATEIDADGVALG